MILTPQRSVDNSELRDLYVQGVISWETFSRYVVANASLPLQERLPHPLAPFGAGGGGGTRQNQSHQDARQDSGQDADKVVKTTDKAADDKTPDKAADKAADKANQEADKAADKTADKAADKAADKVAKEAADKVARRRRARQRARRTRVRNGGGSAPRRVVNARASKPGISVYTTRYIWRTTINTSLNREKRWSA